jgi:hypothetical protein
VIWPLWPGSLILSDPVKLDVPALAHLAVSTYLPGELPVSLPISFHNLPDKPIASLRAAIIQQPSICQWKRRNSRGIS